MQKRRFSARDWPGHRTDPWETLDRTGFFARSLLGQLLLPGKGPKMAKFPINAGIGNGKKEYVK